MRSLGWLIAGIVVGVVVIFAVVAPLQEGETPPEGPPPAVPEGGAGADPGEESETPGHAGEVVVYTALDREFSEPVLDAFQKNVGIDAQPVYDAESTKTVGLVERIRSESETTPRCDVFWNNEIVNTIRLKADGVLQPLDLPEAPPIPEQFRDPDGYWIGFAARCRVLIVNTDLVPPEERPSRLTDLADAKWKGKVGIAKPLFGTTATHVAVLFSLGEKAAEFPGWEKYADGERLPAEQFLLDLLANEVKILAGNKQCARSVSSGMLPMALTDTDDAIIEKEDGKPVEFIYLDREDDELGTLYMPNTLAVVKDCPHPEAARKLIAHLVSPEVETALAKAASAQIPLNPDLTDIARVETPATVKAMEVDWDAAAESFDRAAAFINDEFLE